MRIWMAALGILFLLALLTWLLLRGIADAPAYEMTLKAFDDFALAEASLQRDLVQARAGLLRNYDTLVRANDTIREALARLRSYARTERLNNEPVERLAAMVAQQEELTERFKSSNALLQNSLSYLGLLEAWTADRPRINEWWARVQEWPSFRRGLHDLITEAEFAEMRTHGPKIRADVDALVAGLRAR